MKPPTKWTPAEATRKINECARGDPAVALTLHAKEQMLDRGLIMGDVLHLLKCGFVYEEPEDATRGHFKYRVEGTTPNSDRRTVRVVIIPSGDCHFKIITVMWRRKMTRVIDYRYDECGLDNVILKNFRIVIDDAGEEVVMIPNINLLHKVLTRLVAEKKRGSES